MTGEITRIDTSFLDDRFTLSDWYFPGTAIGVNYSAALEAMLRDEDDHYVTSLALSSSDFDVSDAVIRLAASATTIGSFVGSDLCEVCFGGSGVGQCASQGAPSGYCRDVGLSVQLLDAVDAINAAGTVQSVYSIEVTSYEIGTDTAAPTSSDQTGYALLEILKLLIFSSYFRRIRFSQEDAFAKVISNITFSITKIKG